MRQLRNAVETMVVLDFDGMLDLDDLPRELARRHGAATASADGRSGTLAELVGKPLDDIERLFIAETLKLTGGNREEAAQDSGHRRADAVSEDQGIRAVDRMMSPNDDMTKPMTRWCT